MSPKNRAIASILEFQPADTFAIETTGPVKAGLLSIGEDGSLLVRTQTHEFPCEFLETQTNVGLRLEVGDRLLVLPPSEGQLGIVLGRIGRYQPPQTPEHIAIEASETLVLKCGEASVELRKNGKAMVKGEDVLLRAKGVQRIRAGTVAIN